MVAAVRVANENGHLVLRGMYIDERLQRQGIGSALLAAVDSFLGLRGCWCIPYAHLRDFYAAIGFGEHSAGEPPEFLVKRLESYVAAGRPVVLMWRPGEPCSCGRPD
ncbi:MAG: GNAT family N-acetyltransferase [bacterium]|nr:GNAT family N-acetyltransferase [bacterium]